MSNFDVTKSKLTLLVNFIGFKYLKLLSFKKQ